MIAINVQACQQNHPCPAVRYCAEGALVQNSIYEAPHIDHDTCTGCGACTRLCRVFSRVMDEVPVA